MKNFILLFFLLFAAVTLHSQVVTGVYKGKMVSDSLAYAVDFELTLKEKNGELFGYCQRLFLIEDVLYYNLVKVKARIKDDVLIVEDEKSVSNNFREKKTGIKTVYYFQIKDIIDTATLLKGEWSTSAWRRNSSMPGTLVVNREQNYLSTQLYKRLEEKKLDKEMLFEKTTNPQQTLATTTVVKKEPASINKPVVTASNQQVKQKETVPVANKPAQPVTAAAKDSVPATIVATVQQNQQSQSTNPTTNKPATVTQPKPTPQQHKQPQGQPPVTVNTGNPPTTTNKPETKPAEPKPLSTVTSTIAPQQQATAAALPPVTTTAVVINNPVIIKRQTEIIDALELTGDSITLSLYDNGEIDGDTVSVFLNNELLVSKVGLKAAAHKQTVALKPGETIQLTLFAENLGSIPPNTGLLIITTGNERYQVHFSSTLNKSSSVMLRRKE